MTEVLAILDQHQAKATFFLVGQQLAKFPGRSAGRRSALCRSLAPAPALQVSGTYSGALQVSGTYSGWHKGWWKCAEGACWFSDP